MGAHGIMGDLFITISCNITIIGKVWLVLLVVLRFPALLLAGFPLYGDEQERFVCNTIQPGCANACYDISSPLSPLRFWPVQLLSLLLPLAVFAACVFHRVSVASLAAESPGSPLYDVEHLSTGMLRNPCAVQGRGSDTRGRVFAVQGRGFASAYLAQVLLRTGLEAGFGAAQYLLFGLGVPRKFVCYEAPCTSMVECFTSRPAEKSTMLLFTLGLSALSLLLSLADLAYAFWWCVRQRRERVRTVMKTMHEEDVKEKVEEKEEDYLSLNHVRADLGASTAFRKRGASQSRAEEPGSAHLLEVGDRAVGTGTHLKEVTGPKANCNNALMGTEGDGEGGEMELNPSEPRCQGTPRPKRPPPTPRQGRRPIGTPTMARAQRVGQRTLVDTMETRPESADSERRAW
ncbi:hypothetical protein JZ751_000013, partial [Albula glossodonta]